MPNYLHRTTKEYIVSRSPSGLAESVANYIEDPDLSAVAGQPSKYWIITGDIVTLMDAAGMAAVDAAELLALNIEIETDLTTLVDASGDSLGLRTRAMIELHNTRINYAINRIEELQNTLIALQASAGNAGNRLDAMPTNYMATATRTKGDAVQDYKDDIAAGNQR